jgi:hypothetical protein
MSRLHKGILSEIEAEDVLLQLVCVGEWAVTEGWIADRHKASF